MRRIVGIWILCGFMFSCQNINKSPKPENLIPEDKMVDVLTELSLLHGARSYNRALMEEKGIDPYPYLTRKFGIDSVQLVTSNDYYAQNYRQYKRIYDSVKVRLESLVVEYDSIREMEELKRDSIMKSLRNKDTLPESPVKRDSLKRDSVVPLRSVKSLPTPISSQQ